MKNKLISFISGLIFAVGLGLSGMIQPQKIINFLNIFGDWDYSLIFVMGSAVFISGISYLIIKKLKKPILSNAWNIPTNGSVDHKLIFGSALFGVGWGLSGFCPGPAVVSLVTLNKSSILFVISMLTGMILFQIYKKVC